MPSLYAISACTVPVHFPYLELVRTGPSHIYSSLELGIFRPRRHMFIGSSFAFGTERRRKTARKKCIKSAPNSFGLTASSTVAIISYFSTFTPNIVQGLFLLSRLVNRNLSSSVLQVRPMLPWLRCSYSHHGVRFLMVPMVRWPCGLFLPAITSIYERDSAVSLCGCPPHTCLPFSRDDLRYHVIRAGSPFSS